MQRLIALTLFLVTAVSQLQAQQQVHHYTIGGDVAAPQTYQWPDSQPIAVQDLLHRAGADSKAGRAFILRGSEYSLAAVEQTVAGHPYRGQPLNSGDVVIFRADQPTPQLTTANAFVLLNAVPDLLPLNQTTPALSTLLDGVEFPSGHQLRVTRIQGDDAVSVFVGRNEPLRNGDLVHLTESLSAAGLSTTALKLRYARNPADHSKETVDALIDQTPATTGDTETAQEFRTIDPVDEQLALMIPGSSESHLDTSETRTAVLEPETSGAATRSDNGQMELRTAQSETFNAHDDISVVATSEPTVVRTISLQTDSDDLFSERLPTEPAPLTAADATGGTLWNVVFVGGLLFAMSLIIVGWLKTQQEREMEAQMNQSTRESLATTAAPTSEQPRMLEESKSQVSSTTAAAGLTSN